MQFPFVFHCAAVALSNTLCLSKEVEPVAASRLGSATTICAQWVSCPHPAMHFTRVSGRREAACGADLGQPVAKVGMVKRHNRLWAASPKLASKAVGHRSAAPSGDVILPAAAA